MEEQIKFTYQLFFQQMDSPQNIEQQMSPQQQRNERLQQKQQNQQQLKGGQASRRSRKDIEGRDFVCGCGKKYLSYPALYTHIKTKHDGRQPEGTMKYSTTAPAKKTKTKLEEQHLSYLLSLVRREDMKLLDLLAPKFTGTTAISARLKSKILQKQITDTYHSLLKSTMSPLRLTKQSTLQQLLVAWLIGVGEFVTQKLHDQYQWFARTVKECYYQMGNEVYNKCFSKKDGGLCYVPNFKVEKVKYFPLICDFYIRFFLPYEYSELNINLMELILTDFCNWLMRRKCTFIEIYLNKDYKLNAPLQIEEETPSDKEKKSPEDQDKADRSQLDDGYSEMQLNIKDSQNQEQNPEQKLNQLNIQVQLNQQQDLPLDQNQLQQPKQIQQNLKHQLSEPAQSIVNLTNPEFKEQAQNTFKSQASISQNQRVPEAKTIHNWSLQPEPASESSQEIPQQNQPQVVDEKKCQSEVPHHEHEVQNDKEEALSEKP